MGVGWTVLIDEAAAECMKHCGKLVKIGFNDSWCITGLAFLAACQAHRVVEEIMLPCSRMHLRAALDLVTAKNKDTREYRGRFESLAGDRHVRAAFSRVLEKVNDKPHIIFLALTSMKHLLSGQQG